MIWEGTRIHTLRVGKAATHELQKRNQATAICMMEASLLMGWTRTLIVGVSKGYHRMLEQRDEARAIWIIFDAINDASNLLHSEKVSCAGCRCNQ